MDQEDEIVEAVGRTQEGIFASVVEQEHSGEGTIPTDAESVEEFLVPDESALSEMETNEEKQFISQHTNDGPDDEVFRQPDDDMDDEDVDEDIEIDDSFDEIPSSATSCHPMFQETYVQQGTIEEAQRKAFNKGPHRILIIALRHTLSISENILFGRIQEVFSDTRIRENVVIWPFDVSDTDSRDSLKNISTSLGISNIHQFETPLSHHNNYSIEDYPVLIMCGKIDGRIQILGTVKSCPNKENLQELMEQGLTVAAVAAENGPQMYTTIQPDMNEDLKGYLFIRPSDIAPAEQLDTSGACCSKSTFLTVADTMKNIAPTECESSVENGMVNEILFHFPDKHETKTSVVD